jgi:hypothetical protein
VLSPRPQISLVNVSLWFLLLQCFEVFVNCWWRSPKEYLLWQEMCPVRTTCNKGIYSPTLPSGNVVQHVCTLDGLCHDLFIWQTRFRPKYSTPENIPSRLEFDCITEWFDIWWYYLMPGMWLYRRSTVPLPPPHSYSQIPSSLIKSSDPHYLLLLSTSFVVSATPWRSEWTKCLHTAIDLALMHDHTVRMGLWAG